MTPRWSSVLTGSQVFEADCRTVAATLPDGVASLAILDGPYFLGKADWDRAPRGVTLGDVYREHLDDVGRVCGPSASLYLWNTSVGWAELHPLVLARGWVFRRLIVWDKGNASGLLFAENAGMFGEAAEYCGIYTRGRPWFTTNGEPSNIWRLPHGAWTSERIKSGTIGTALGGTNEWAEPLHPCQKPLLFAERMIRASSRPGDTVWVPFGGTLRELVAAERIARADPGEARRVVTCEINADGRDYIGAALEQVEGRAGVDRRQVQMFGSQP